jgi:hypothetical protein
MSVTLTLTENIAAKFADAGARMSAGMLCLHAPNGRTNVLSAAPPGLATDAANAHGALALTAVFERRVAVQKIHGDGRYSDAHKAKLTVEPELAAFRDLAVANHEVSRIEKGLAESIAQLNAVPQLEPGDAAGATCDVERRAYLRSLPSKERVQAIRADPRLMLAAVRDPVLAGITEHERSRLDSAWEAACAERDPAFAKRIEECSERAQWARRAVTAATRQLACETKTDPVTIMASLDPIDSLRLADLVTFTKYDKQFVVLADQGSRGTPILEMSPTSFGIG